MQEAYSFKTQNKAIKSYKDFISHVMKEDYPGCHTLKENRRHKSDDGKENELILKNILKDIKIPDFYNEISELEGVELIQGSHIVEKPHYERREQIMCLIDGNANFVLVPHVNRQEAYTGQVSKESPYYEGATGQEPAFEDYINTSPVNFFSMKLKKYKNMRGATRQIVDLKPGDCIFIPAYYLYQFQS